MDIGRSSPNTEKFSDLKNPKRYPKIQYDQDGDAFMVIGGNRKVWITNVAWIENLFALLEKEEKC